MISELNYGSESGSLRGESGSLRGESGSLRGELISVLSSLAWQEHGAL